MELSELQRNTLLRALQDLAANGPVDTAYGICFNVQEFVNEELPANYRPCAYTLVGEVSVHWPGRNGAVDDLGVCMNPIRTERTELGRVPLWEGSQLEQRMSLIAFLTEYLKAQGAE